MKQLERLLFYATDLYGALNFPSMTKVLVSGKAHVAIFWGLFAPFGNDFLALVLNLDSTYDSSFGSIPLPPLPA